MEQLRAAEGRSPRSQIHFLRFCLDAVRGVTTLEDFENLVAMQKPILDKISANDKQLRKLNRSMEHIENFNRYSPIYAQSQKGFAGAKEKYAAEHKAELEAFAKAVRYLKANRLTAAELNECRKQRDALRAENRKLRAELTALNLDPEMIRGIRRCVDTVLSHAGEIPESKPSTLARLTTEKEAVPDRQNPTVSQTPRTGALILFMKGICRYGKQEITQSRPRYVQHLRRKAAYLFR